MAAIKMDDALQEQVKQLLAAASRKVFLFVLAFLPPVAVALGCVWVVLHALRLVQRGRARLFHLQPLSQQHPDIERQLLQDAMAT